MYYRLLAIIRLTVYWAITPGFRIRRVGRGPCSSSQISFSWSLLKQCAVSLFVDSEFTPYLRNITL